uniref:Uncharacterized protein n=2 Tax=Cacopsylla melanoneura TaxID=428564 RepID=A0A8D8M844_9HEMI
MAPTQEVARATAPALETEVLIMAIEAPPTTTVLETKEEAMKIAIQVMEAMVVQWTTKGMVDITTVDLAIDITKGVEAMEVLAPMIKDMAQVLILIDTTADQCMVMIETDPVVTVAMVHLLAQVVLCDPMILIG